SGWLSQSPPGFARRMAANGPQMQIGTHGARLSHPASVFIAYFSPAEDSRLTPPSVSGAILRMFRPVTNIMQD
ncbi:MAG: hypothetical protein ACYDDO_05335, partial [Acidiferrobacterales bacterium]